MSERLLKDDLAGSAEGGTTSMVTMIANFVTGGLGVGILSLPWSAAGASVFPAVIINALVMFLMAYTCCIVLEACEKYKIFDLGALVRLLPGRLGPLTEGLCNLVIWVGMFMCLLGYMIVVADSILPMLSGGALDSRVALITLSSAVCLPLCYLDQEYLSFSSWLAIAVNVYLFMLVGYLSISNPWTGTPACSLGFGRGIASMFNMLMMAVVMQMLVPPMYETLERRSVARFRIVIYCGFASLFLLFVGFQTVALYAFGPDVPQDILTSLPSNTAGNAVRYGMIGIVLGCYPIMMMPMVAPIRNAKWGGPFTANWSTLVIGLSGMVVSYYVTQLGVLNVINGAISVLALVTVAPALIGIYLVGRSKCAMLLLIAMGMTLFLLGFLLPLNYVNQVQASCLWR